MVSEIYRSEQRKLVQMLYDQGFRNEQILQAIFEVPRGLFVEEAFEHRSSENISLPIGEGQTISQPYIVTRMTSLLELEDTDKVLEIGTGSGYQTAILAKLSNKVYSIERIKKLQLQALYRLKRLELHNVHLRHADGWQGWKSEAPFKAIIVTAAAEYVPSELLKQLQNGGCLVIPVGGEKQVLQRIIRIGNDFNVENIEAVKFVPLIEGDIR